MEMAAWIAFLLASAIALTTLGMRWLGRSRRTPSNEPCMSRTVPEGDSTSLGEFNDGPSNDQEPVRAWLRWASLKAGFLPAVMILVFGWEMAHAAQSSMVDTVNQLLVYGFCGAVYFLPSLLLTRRWRGARHARNVVLVNLFLGWTVVGWCVALSLATFPEEGRRAS